MSITVHLGPRQTSGFQPAWTGPVREVLGRSTFNGSDFASARQQKGSTQDAQRKAAPPPAFTYSCTEAVSRNFCHHCSPAEAFSS